MSQERFDAVDTLVNGLKEMTVSLPEWGPGMYRKVDNMMMIETGAVIGLVKDPDVAVAKGCGCKDSVLERHTNPEVEILIVSKGTMRVDVGDEDLYILNAGDLVRLEPGTPHTVSFTENCKYIAITIPSSEHYPDGVL